ncbi:MAG: sulfite exporter TauE/SafE family protein [Clostridia bacterium]|nr:sulfite exporter TauE/SafE family protein [Clostridia bacterium]
MIFNITLIFAVLSGLLGGMGMGGGTILIPALTIFLGVEQHVAQAANLFAFLPMSLISLKVHAGNGLVQKNGILSIIIPAVIVSSAGAAIAAFIPSEALQKLFGAFLVALAIKQLYDLKKLKSKK